MLGFVQLFRIIHLICPHDSMLLESKSGHEGQKNQQIQLISGSENNFLQNLIEQLGNTKFFWNN